MVTKTIKYTNYNGEEKTKTCLFALSKADLIKLNAKYGDISEYVGKLTKNNDTSKFVDFFIDEIVVKAYGEKSEDGESFIKDPARTTAFRYSPACDELLMELLTDESGGDITKFIEDIMPADIKSKMIDAANKSAPLELK